MHVEHRLLRQKEQILSLHATAKNKMNELIQFQNAQVNCCMRKELFHPSAVQI